jgi:cytochrome c oxidase cbb3-type subunit 3
MPSIHSRLGLNRWRFVLALAVFLGGAQSVSAQGANPGTPAAQGTDAYGNLLQVPINTFAPGAVSVRPKLKLPKFDDAAAQRGMKAFSAFNCVGCHMGSGGGGMGPALSNSFFIYGAEPENIYLSIIQGRPNGMPAWGAVLPGEIVWDLVAYVKSISNEPKSSSWGTTISIAAPADVQQIPLELQSSAKPWDFTEKFSHGQKP